MENDSKQSVRTRTQTEAPASDDSTLAAPVRSSNGASAPSAPSPSSPPAAPRPVEHVAPSPSSSSSPVAIPAELSSTPTAVVSNAPAVVAAAGPVARDATIAPPLDPLDPAGSFDHDAQTQLDLPDPAPQAAWAVSDGARQAAPLGPSLAPQPPVSPLPPYPGAAPVSPRMPSPLPGQIPAHVPWEAASSWGATTLTISANTAAGASYLFWWVSGMLIYFNERHNRFVRFHAMQSILLTGAMTVFAVLAYILSALCGDLYMATGLHAYRTMGTGIAALAVVIIVIPWLWAMIAAWSGNYMRLPVVGTYAERYSAPPLHPPTTF